MVEWRTGNFPLAGVQLFLPCAVSHKALTLPPSKENMGVWMLRQCGVSRAPQERHAAKLHRVKKHQKHKQKTKINTGEGTSRWRANARCRRVTRQVMSNKKTNKKNTGAQKLYVSASLATTSRSVFAISYKKKCGCMDCALEWLTAMRATNASRSFVA